MRKTLKFNTDKTFSDITGEVASLSKEWGKSGLVNIFSRHTTCSIWMTENEKLHLADLDNHLKETFPADGRYLHDQIHLRNDTPKDERINGHSHMRSMYFSSSETIPVEDGELLVGKWKSLFFVELDPCRDRELVVTFIEM